MEKDTNNLGQGSVGALIFRLAVPAIAAQIINLLYNIVDRMYIGHIPEIGKTALTGVGVTFPIIMIISAFSALIGMGGAPQAAIKMGKGDYKSAEKILGTCFERLLSFPYFLQLLYLFFKEICLCFLAEAENTIGYAVDYLTIYSIGTILFRWFLV